MESSSKLPIDSEESDDDDLKQEITETVEKFVQTRHVQTLKYLQHVIDENRHLRLHIEHLKRRQNDPVRSPGAVDPIDPEDPPIDEIPVEVPEIPEIVVPTKIFNTIGTNTEGEDFQAKCKLLNEQIANLQKEHRLNHQEFQRELERLDEKNVQYEKDLRQTQEQLIHLQKEHHEKLLELRTFSGYFNDERLANQRLNERLHEVEQNNEKLRRLLSQAEKYQIHLDEEIRNSKIRLENNENRFADLQKLSQNQVEQIEQLENDVEKLRLEKSEQIEKVQELQEENLQSRQHVELLQQQLEEKIRQEEKALRDRQANNHFKDFVQIKRTLQICQQENEHLKVELKKVQMKLLMN